MRKSATMTVGDLISELCRWPDHATIAFRCAGERIDPAAYRLGSPEQGVVEIVLDLVKLEIQNVAG